MTEQDRARVKELVIDEWIWVVFIILSVLNISGDEIEKHFCYHHEKKDKEISRKIFTLTVFVSFLIYLYLAYKNCKKCKVLREEQKDTTLMDCRACASILVVTASSLFVYAQLKDKQPINPSIE